MSDKRIADRTETSIPAHLIAERFDVPCTILDLSSTGARLLIGPGVFLPKILVLKAQELGGDRPVEVVWRNKTQIGVRF